MCVWMRMCVCAVEFGQRARGNQPDHRDVGTGRPPLGLQEYCQWGQLLRRHLHSGVPRHAVPCRLRRPAIAFMFIYCAFYWTVLNDEHELLRRWARDTTHRHKQRQPVWTHEERWWCYSILCCAVLCADARRTVRSISRGPIRTNMTATARVPSASSSYRPTLACRTASRPACRSTWTSRATRTMCVNTEHWTLSLALSSDHWSVITVAPDTESGEVAVEDIRIAKANTNTNT